MLHATLRASAVARPAAARPCGLRPLAPRCTALRVSQSSNQQTEEAQQHSIAPVVALSTAMTTLMASGNALAATELAQLAESDARLGVLATLFLPVLGWVAFNIAGPLFNQLDVMGDKAAEATPDKRSIRVKRGVAAGLGLGAAGLLASAPAEAATQIATIAESDARLGVLATLFLPVLGWVAFNIAGPLFNQLDVMGEKAAEATPDKRSIRRK